MSQPYMPPRPTSPKPIPGLLRAIAHVAQGGLVILPTDTVYGIGCQASCADAVARLQAAKGRDESKPPPVLVADPQDLGALTQNLAPAAQALIEAFWPGPLTLILPAAPDLSWQLGQTGGTIAVRMPNHPQALELLRGTGPMAVTSANRTGAPPATNPSQARSAFPGRVIEDDAAEFTDATKSSAATSGPSQSGADIVLLDGGNTPGPTPSTIVDLSGSHAQGPVIVRAGAIEASLIEQTLARTLTQEGRA